MNSFDALVADFAEKTGVPSGKTGADSIDVIADGVLVSAQHRPERDDCVIFTLPLADAKPDCDMLRRALELAADGTGTAGHFLGLNNGMFVLSAVLPLEGLSTEDFAKRLLMLAAASHAVAQAILSAPIGGGSSGGDREVGLPTHDKENDLMRV